MIIKNINELKIGDIIKYNPDSFPYHSHYANNCSKIININISNNRRTIRVSFISPSNNYLKYGQVLLHDFRPGDFIKIEPKMPDYLKQ